MSSSFGENTPDPVSNSGEQLRHRLHSVLEVGLTPETINNYADIALSGLIAIVDAAREQYERQPTIQHASRQEAENAAVHFFELPNISGTLDHISRLSLEIQSLDEVIASVVRVDDILVPPDSGTTIEGTGLVPTNIEQRQLIPRLKTTLFVLSKEFDIDVADTTAVTMHNGRVTRTMMREVSYTQVEVPSINRVILVCDEEENATFVLDRTLIRELLGGNTKASSLSKSQLKSLLNDNAMVGRRIVYSDDFVGDVIDALRDLQAIPTRDTTAAAPNKYLYPRAVGDVLSLRQTAIELGLSRKNTNKAVAALEGKLGIVNQFKFGANTTDGYTVEQRARIREQAVRDGYYAPKAEEVGALTPKMTAKALKLSRSTTQIIVDELGEDFGDIEDYRFPTGVRAGYSESQQALIREKARLRGNYALEAPDDIMSVNALASLFGVTHKTMQAAIDARAEQLGILDIFKFSGTPAVGLTPTQQNIVRDYLVDKELHCKPAPEGVHSVFTIGRTHRLGTAALFSLIEKHREEIGPAGRYKFGPTVADGYTSEQQEIILALARRRKQ